MTYTTDELPGYCEHMQFMTMQSQQLLGDKSLLLDFRTAAGIGIMDIKSERGTIPIIAAEIYQPYFADAVRPAAADAAGLRLVPNGRPDAVLDISDGLDAVLRRLPRAENKRRQWKRGQSLTWGYAPRPLPWRQSYQHLMLKYDGLDVSGLSDEWFDLPEPWWNHYKWVTLTSESGTLGGAIFQCSPDRGEWFWIASALDYENPQVHELAVGNLLLLRGLEMATAAGAGVFNFGVDRFDYKPQVWGTQRRWSSGMEYVDA